MGERSCRPAFCTRRRATSNHAATNGIPTRYLGRICATLLYNTERLGLVTIACVLGLGTYPIQRPVHGGQRRVAAFRQYYEDVGIAYTYACVYNPAHYDGSDVGVHDYKLDSFKCPSLSNVIGDLMSGHQAAA